MNHNPPDAISERHADALTVYRILAALSPADKEATAYDHVTHACPLDGWTEEDGSLIPVFCPICVELPTPELFV